MELLNLVIEELYKEESYWNICRPCQCNGYCCKGADISVDSNEWSIIKKFVQQLSFEEKAVLQKNIIRGTQCIFRATNKCIIHDIRSENCRYTPYQVNVDSFNTLRYTMVRFDPITKHCLFKSVRKEIRHEERIMIEQTPFVALPKYGSVTKYISLNWLVKHNPSNTNVLPVSKWIKNDPLVASEQKS